MESKSFYLFVYFCVWWELIVAFINVLTIYQVYHTEANRLKEVHTFDGEENWL
jgi:hypothetical protein